MRRIIQPSPASTWKPKPKTTIINAPKSDTGIAGISHIRTVSASTVTITILRFMSRDVRSSEAAPAPFILFIAPLKVLTIRGKDLIRLIIFFRRIDLARAKSHAVLHVHQFLAPRRDDRTASAGFGILTQRNRRANQIGVCLVA